MEDLCSSLLWCYPESFDGVRQKLEDTLSELEVLRMEAAERSTKHKDEINNILNLLLTARNERDEAIHQLKNLISPSANSTITTESNNLSPSHGATHDTAVSSSECDDPTAEIDQCEDDDVIEDLVKGKTLPARGNLLRSVIEAGPLLQTLLVAGSLPRWNNPPPPQCSGIPPAAVEGCVDASGLGLNRCLPLWKRPRLQYH